MKDQKEIQIAWEIWNLIEKLNNPSGIAMKRTSLKSISKRKRINSLASSNLRTLHVLRIKWKGNPESIPPKRDS